MPLPSTETTRPEAPAGDRSAVAGESATALPSSVASGNGRNLALAILATLAVIVALHWAKAFVISLLLGILFAYTLNPIVVWLERIRIPRLAGASIAVLGVVGALILGGYSLRGEVQAILDQLPQAVSKLTANLASLRKDQAAAMQKVQTAAIQIEKATAPSLGTDSAPKKAATRVVIEPPGFKFGSFLWAGSLGAVGLIGEIVMVVFLTYFLLLSGDTYKRKLVRLTGPSLANKKITVHLLDEINDSIQRYMFMLLVTNVLLGLSTWIALRWIGLENAGAWALAAGLLHVIPYFGPALTAAAIGLVAFMQFDTLPTALLAAGTSLTIATLVGSVVTTWMTGRIARMNTAAVFVSLLFWGWLWGIWGMLLSIPITVIVKVVTQHIEPLQAFAELLGD